jgi:hypothetical protein
MTKSWYLSKTFWAGVAVFLVGVCNQWNLIPGVPQIPSFVLMALGFLVTMFRFGTNTTLTK